jgi:hypothetical protein
MGQYYSAISLDAETYLSSHDHSGGDGGFNGLKLMEHSYIGNPLTAAVENLIKEGGAWYGHRIVWGGDYADPEPNTGDKENPDGYNLYELIQIRKIVPAKDQERNENLNYLINLDKNEFVDLSKVEKDNYGLKIHPLPLLTCEGNGRGGGDFWTENEEYLNLIGSWARNKVTIQSKKPKDMKEIKFNLVED